MNTTVVDFSSVLQPVLQVVGMVLIGFLLKYLAQLLQTANAHFNLKLTDQQLSAVTDAVNTAAGVIETMIDQKAMSVAHVTVTNEHVRTQAQNIIDAAPSIAAMLGLTVSSVSQMIVGAVDTGSRTPPPAPAPAPTPAA